MKKSFNRPNVVVIHCHDLGRHLGCYGRGLETSNIDNLAKEGILFTNYFSTAPYCCPSRASRITGLLPVNHGVMGASFLGWSIRPGIRTLPMYLNDAGYDTYLFGYQHEACDGKTLGYKNYKNGTPYASGYALDVTPKVEAFLENYDRNKGPFYADVGFMEVHEIKWQGWPSSFWQGEKSQRRFKPIYINRSELKDKKYNGKVVIFCNNPSDPYFKEYSSNEVQPLPYLPDLPGIRADIADLNSYVTCVIDAMVGRILKKMKDTGLDKNTIVVFTTDHGIDMPRAKGTLYDAGIESALILRFPDGLKADTVCDKLLSGVDFLPTILELCDVNPPGNIDGKSFLPWIEGRAYEARECIYAENTWHGTYMPLRAIRTKDFKYIRRFHSDLSDAYFFGVPESRAAQALLGVYRMSIANEEFYDLKEDPHEKNNLASEDCMLTYGSSKPIASYEDKIKTFSRQLKAHMQQTTDPLLFGPIPHPGFKCIWKDQK